MKFRIHICLSLFGNIQEEVIEDAESVRIQQQNHVQQHSCTLDDCFQLYTKEEQVFFHPVDFPVYLCMLKKAAFLWSQIYTAQKNYRNTFSIKGDNETPGTMIWSVWTLQLLWKKAHFTSRLDLNSFIIFKPIQAISGSGGSAFILA